MKLTNKRVRDHVLEL